MGNGGKWRGTASSSRQREARITLKAHPRARRSGSFVSQGSSPKIGGTWGVYDRSLGVKVDRRSALQDRGTHLWLSVKRERSETTLRGVGGLPVQVRLLRMAAAQWTEFGY